MPSPHETFLRKTRAHAPTLNLLEEFFKVERCSESTTQLLLLYYSSSTLRVRFPSSTLQAEKTKLPAQMSPLPLSDEPPLPPQATAASPSLLDAEAYHRLHAHRSVGSRGVRLHVC